MQGIFLIIEILQAALLIGVLFKLKALKSMNVENSEKGADLSEVEERQFRSMMSYSLGGEHDKA